jgi:hypothetical protein
VWVRDVCVWVGGRVERRTPEPRRPAESVPWYSETRKTYLPGTLTPKVVVSGLPPFLPWLVASRSSFTSVIWFLLQT